MEQVAEPVRLGDAWRDGVLVALLSQQGGPSSAQPAPDATAEEATRDGSEDLRSDSCFVVAMNP